MRRPFLLVLAVVALAAAGVALSAGPRTDTVTGVVVAVDAVSLTDVRSFTLRVVGGQTMRFSLSGLQNGTEFPPGHLTEHIGSGGPVLVTYRNENGVLSAIRVVDASVPTAT